MSISFAVFCRLPGNTPEVDTTLKSNELILSIDLPASPFAPHSYYLKVRDRASHEFALVSVAAALHLEGNQIRDAWLALGGVAHEPWRPPQAEESHLARILPRARLYWYADLLLARSLPHSVNHRLFSSAGRGTFDRQTYVQVTKLIGTCLLQACD